MTGDVSNSLEDWFAMPKTCKKGHAIDAGNIYLTTDKRNGAVKESCRTCDIDRRPEKAIQGEIVRNLRALGWFVSTLSQAQRAQMTAGLPDMVAMHPRHGTFWCEVKVPRRRTELRGGLSLDQLQWHIHARDCGMTVIIAYGWADVAAELERRGVRLG